jgi:hypothetical protein
MKREFIIILFRLYIASSKSKKLQNVKKKIVHGGINTRSAGGALPESANTGQIDRREFYCLLIYIKLIGEDKYLKIINCLKAVIFFCHVYTCVK